MNLTTSTHSSPSRGSDTSLGGPTGGSSPEVQRQMTDWRRLFSLREMGVYYALVLLVSAISFVTVYTGRPSYLSLSNISNVLYQASLVAIMAVAMTVILITGNFDLSVASVAALSAAVLVSLADTLGFWPAAGVAMLVSILAGLLNGAIVQYLGINAFIVTLGTLTAIRGVVQIYTDGQSLSVQTPEALQAMRMFESGRFPIAIPLIIIAAGLLLAGLRSLVRARRQARNVSVTSLGMIIGAVCCLALVWAGGMSISMPKPVVYMFVFTIVVWFVLNLTTIGRRVYAVGGNPEAARLSGINVQRYKMAGFILCSAAAGFGGVLFGSRLGAVNPTAMQGAELTVIASAILGGTSLFGGAGSVIKTLAGALLLFTLTNGFNILNLGANYQGVIEGTVVVSAAAIYTVGGARRRKR